jgi:3-oxoacyl-[acyl-carrier protein] reductase
MRVQNERVAIVTGVAYPNSMGFATAKVLGESGASVVCLDVSELVHEARKTLCDAGLAVSSYVVDLTRAQEVAQVVDDVMAQHSRIDVLANIAGCAPAGGRRPYVRIVDMDEERWDWGIAINLKTQFLCCRAVLPHMLKQRSGRIVNVSSTTGPVSASKGNADYAAAKAGIVGLTRILALEVAGEGVLVNAVAPGWINTGQSSKRGLAAGAAVPVGRAGRPEEIAKLIAFLASDDNSYMTGQLIVCDGGNGLEEYRGPGSLGDA